MQINSLTNWIHGRLCNLLDPWVPLKLSGLLVVLPLVLARVLAPGDALKSGLLIDLLLVLALDLVLAPGDALKWSEDEPGTSPISPPPF